MTVGRTNSVTGRAFPLPNPRHQRVSDQYFKAYPPGYPEMSIYFRFSLLDESESEDASVRMTYAIVNTLVRGNCDIYNVDLRRSVSGKHRSRFLIAQGD